MLTPKDEDDLREFLQKRELVAGRLAKLDPRKKEYAWEKEQLDDLDRAIRNLRAKASDFIRPDPASVRFPDKT